MVSKLAGIVLLIAGALMQSCTRSSLTPKEYVAYCNDESNGLIRKREFGSLIYSLKYEPVEYKALQELLGANGVVRQQDFEPLKKEYDSLYYFSFKIESPDSEKSPIKSLAKNEGDLAKLNMYCQTHLQEAFYMESGGHKIPCVLFHVEDDHNLTSYNIMSMAFDASELGNEQDLVFVFEDPLFKTGLIKFTLSKKQIDRLPTLKFS